MWIPKAHNRLAKQSAAAIYAAFGDYGANSRPSPAAPRFASEQRDWHGLQQDALERLELYPRVIARGVAEIRQLLEFSSKDKKLWATMKSAYADLIGRCQEIELAETFLTRSAGESYTIGVDPRIEFLFSDFDTPAEASGPPIFRTYPASGTLVELISGSPRPVNSQRLRRPPAQCAPGGSGRRTRAPRRGQRQLNRCHRHDSGRLLPQPGHYLVGRIRSGDQVMPLTLALHHQAGGIVVDAVLLSADEVSIIFSFTRSYFHVEVHRPRDLVVFLKSFMPRKPIAELYIAIGYNKHGKTELYRDLMRHIDRSTDTLEIAPGDRGMVMCVFTLPSFDVVFKVIRDRFAYPKTSSRRDVMERYQLVFKHDRAGRLADVQEFEHLAFAATGSRRIC